MKVVKDLRYVVNKTLKEMSEKRPGRFVFFLLFSLIFGIISLLLIYAVSTVVGYFTIARSIDFLEVFFVQKWFWIIIASLISPIYIVFVLKYFDVNQKKKHRSYKIGSLFQSIDSKTFLFFTLSVVTLTFLFTFFFFKDLGLGGVVDSQLETLLDLMGGDGMYSIEKWLDTLLMFVFKVLPLMVVIYFGMSLKKDFTWKNCWAHRRSFVTFTILYFVLLEVDAMFWDVSNGLVIHLIGIPFAQNAIPNFFGLGIRLCLTTIFTVLLSYFAHYSLKLTEGEITIKNREKSERTDLLDDTF